MKPGPILNSEFIGKSFFRLSRKSQRRTGPIGGGRNNVAAPMARKGTKKGRPLEVPPEWLEQVGLYKKATGKTLQQLGAELAEQLHRKTPVPVSTVHDYLVGRVVTEELTLAFAALMGVTPPVLVTTMDADPEMREWLELGRALRAETPDRFQREIVALRELVEALRRHRLR